MLLTVRPLHILAVLRRGPKYPRTLGTENVEVAHTIKKLFGRSFVVVCPVARVVLWHSYACQAMFDILSCD